MLLHQQRKELILETYHDATNARYIMMVHVVYALAVTKWDTLPRTAKEKDVLELDHYVIDVIFITRVLAL
uniref:hypothetical protein n=1 Tax=Salmonella enterica TaxID=28901 RepID=UPI0020C1C70F